MPASTTASRPTPGSPSAARSASSRRRASPAAIERTLPRRRPLTQADETALAAPLLRAAGAVHLVGHSYGGAVALKLAELFPQAVRSLAVYEPPLFAWLRASAGDAAIVEGVFDLADRIRRSLHQRNPRAAAAHFVDYWSGPGTWAGMPAERQQPVAARVPAVLAQFDALAREAFSLAGLPPALPLLSLSGAKSPRSTRRIAGLIRRQVPGATCEVQPGLGHMGPLTHGAIVFERIERFLSECEASGAAGHRATTPRSVGHGRAATSATRAWWSLRAAPSATTSASGSRPACPPARRNPRSET